MYCTQCGKQLPDDAKFCSACGKSTAVKTAPRPATPVNPKPAAPRPAAPAQNTNQQQGDKKNSNIFVMLVVFVLVYVVAFNITRKDSSSDAPAVNTDTTIAMESTAAAPGFSAPSGLTFDEILPKRYLADKGKMSASGYGAYVKENSDGKIYLMEYGYNGDLVTELCLTTIMPTPGWSTSDIGAFLIETDKIMEELMAEHTFISGNSQIVGDYEYVAVVVHMKELDKEANVQSAVEEQLILVENNAKLISMSQTEESLHIAGYAKK